MKEKQKNTGIAWNVIVVLLILVIAISAGIGIFAWAKYQTTIDETAIEKIAKWSFKVVDGDTTTNEIIDFPMTRTDNNTNVASGILAPGTYGQFEIGIDARGTETFVQYTIKAELSNKPRNLKFYSNSEKTKEIEVVDNVFLVEGFMSLEDVKEVKTEIIYWDWKYETGDTDTEIKQNDIKDTEDSRKTMTMHIAVTGTQVLEEPAIPGKTQKLADVVEVGDYVNYNASSNGTKTFTSSDCLTGTSVSATISTDNKFNSNAKAQWRVLSVDKTKGIVELMSTASTSQIVTLSGGDGFVNAETVLNKIGAIYGQGKGATGGRSITVEDVELYSSYDKTTYKTSDTGDYYGTTRKYEVGNFYKEIKNENGNIIGYESTIDAGKEVMTQTDYNYNAQNYFSNSTIYNMIFKITGSNKLYWLASRCVRLGPAGCSFKVRRVYNGCEVDSCTLYSSRYGVEDSGKCGIVPVVSLKSNILTTGQDESGVWQLKVD